MKREEKFNDYEAFVEKFKPKKTTDDCYTPPEVYEEVLQYVDREVTPLKGRRVERPFRPGGDYRSDAEAYDETVLVIDNPPFSILSEIKRFYLGRGTGFFLFAPHLTLFSGEHEGMQYVVADAPVTFENGAVVNCDFVTNLLDDRRFIVAAPSLHEGIMRAQREKAARKDMPKYRYPDEVLTSTNIPADTPMVEGLSFRRDECCFIRRLDTQIPYRKAIYGNGFLLSRAAAARAAAARAAAARAEDAYVWKLSARERWISGRLGHAGPAAEAEADE